MAYGRAFAWYGRFTPPSPTPPQPTYGYQLSSWNSSNTKKHVNLEIRHVYACMCMCTCKCLSVHIMCCNMQVTHSLVYSCLATRVSGSKCSYFVHPGSDGSREKVFTDKDVCRPFLLGICISDLFVNTVSCLVAVCVEILF